MPTAKRLGSASLLALLALTGACTPLDPDSESVSITTGTYVLDGGSAWGTATREEWTFAASGSLTVSHFTWDASSQSGCYDSRSTGSTWNLSDDRLVLAWSGTASVRPACDSAWRSTTTPRTGTSSLKLRADTLGFDWYDSTAATWHVMRRL